MAGVEVLAPAGSLEIMKEAFQAGADAVYLGGQMYGARAYAANLSEQELIQGIEYSKLHHKRLYLTVNTLMKEKEIDGLFSYLEKLYAAGLDAVIVQDLGAVAYIHEAFPEMEIHASTQMSLTTAYGVEGLKQMGVTRVVPARELSLEEIRRMKENTGLEMEVFVHGALCYAYSGECLLSSMIGGRSGNRGRCAQPCRQLYTLESGRQGYFLSPKDLCGLEMVPELIQAGVDSFKIEGRMKKPEYVISAVQAYRNTIDRYMEQMPFKTEELEQEKRKLADIFNRGGFTEGYYHQRNGKGMMSMDRGNHNGVPVGTVVAVHGGKVTLELSEAVSKGDVLELRTGQGKEIELTAGESGLAGSRLTLNGRQIRQIRLGIPVYRTKNHALCDQLLAENSARELKEKIHISVTLKKDQSAKIDIRCQDVCVSVVGGVVEAAKSHPLQETDIREKLQKLGDTPFQAEAVKVDMDSDCFYSMKEFNELRRQAVQELKEALLSTDRRSGATELSVDTCIDRLHQEYESERTVVGEMQPEKMNPEKKPYLAVSVRREEQLKVALRSAGVDRIDLELEEYTVSELESLIWRIHGRKKLAYVSLPRCFRIEMEAEFLQLRNLSVDGYVVRTYDELGFLRHHMPEVPVVCDYNLYAYNSVSAQVCAQGLQGIKSAEATLTLPVELTGGELRMLTEKTPEQSWEWILYGRQPVMVTAQCSVQNTDGCNHKKQARVMHNAHGDRLQARAICKYCYNVIYLEQPINLFAFRSEQKNPNVRGYRIVLTDEGTGETENILEGVPAAKGQTGHYEKGIE